MQNKFKQLFLWFTPRTPDASPGSHFVSFQVFLCGSPGICPSLQMHLQTWVPLAPLCWVSDCYSAELMAKLRPTTNMWHPSAELKSKPKPPLSRLPMGGSWRYSGLISPSDEETEVQDLRRAQVIQQLLSREHASDPWSSPQVFPVSHSGLSFAHTRKIGVLVQGM